MLEAYCKLKTKPKTIASGSTSSYLGQPVTSTDRQGCERLIKVSDWRLALELGHCGGHFEHSHWQWNSGIWSLVNCAVSTMLLRWYSSFNIFNAEKSVGNRVKKFTTLPFFNKITLSLRFRCRMFCEINLLNFKLKFQTVAKKTTKNFRGLRFCCTL